MTRSLPAAAALCLVLCAGLVHGLWTRRWSKSGEVAAAVARLKRVPATVGGWRGRSIEIDHRQLEVGEIAGYLARRYEDGATGAAVTVLVVCGGPGPISVHTPDVCYAGAGYELTGPPVSRSLPAGPSGQTAVFRSGVFEKSNSPVPSFLRILWSWSAAGPWQAPEYPRLAFASRRALYKMYVIRESDTADERVGTDPSGELLRILLPEVERALFTGP